MKKIIFLITLFSFLSCSEKKTVLDIPLTSSSEEAKRIISDNLFFNNGNTSFRIYSGRTVPALEKVLELDPNFEFAKAIYADIQNNFVFKNNKRREILESAFKNRNKVSDIERAIIESIYYRRVEGNKIKAASVLKQIINENPEYYYLRVYNGFFQNTVMQNPKESKLNWNEALKINPNSNISKFLLAQLHFNVDGSFFILEADEIDLNYATNLLKEIEKSEPSNFEPKRLLGNIYRVYGDFDASLKSYESAIELIEDKSGFDYALLLLLSGHVYVFNSEYEKGRTFYQRAVEVRQNVNFESLVRRWSSNSYLYEKRYDLAIVAIDKLQKDFENYNLDPLTKKGLLSGCAFEKFIAYAHSQMKEEAFESLETMVSLNNEIKEIRVSNTTTESEMNNIVLETELNLQFNKIWYNILFGEYELARESLKNYSLLSSEYLTFDSKAMVGFYKLSGYLNLMEGNIPQSISFYDQIPKALLEKDNYHLYFYALAKKANGNTEESKELFKFLANYNFAGWENSIVRNLAVQQNKI